MGETSHQQATVEGIISAVLLTKYVGSVTFFSRYAVIHSHYAHFWRTSINYVLILTIFQIVTSGLLTQQSVVLSAQDGNFATMPELAECLRASMMIPGVAGEVVRLKVCKIKRCDTLTYAIIAFHLILIHLLLYLLLRVPKLQVLTFIRPIGLNTDRATENPT